MIFSRLVKPRARRMADMQASVPELHMRTFSTLGTAPHTSLAIVTSNGFGIPKLVPCSAVRWTALIIFGCAWPRIAGPQVHT